MRIRSSTCYLGTRYSFCFSPFVLPTVTLHFGLGAVEFSTPLSISCMSKPLTTSGGVDNGILQSRNYSSVRSENWVSFMVMVGGEVSLKVENSHISVRRFSRNDTLIKSKLAGSSRKIAETYIGTVGHSRKEIFNSSGSWQGQDRRLFSTRSWKR